MIIQLYGLPGSGKSFIAKKLEREKAIRIIEPKNRLWRYILVFFYAISSPLAFIFFFKKIYQENKNDRKLLKHKIKFLFFNSIAREQNARISAFIEKKDYSVEEGLIHYVLSIYERKVGKSELQKYLKYLNKKHFIYFIEADDEVRKKRMEERNRIPRSSFGKEYYKKWIEIAEKNNAIFKEILRVKFNFKEIENN